MKKKNAREMPQWVKCFQCNHEDSNLSPQNSSKNSNGHTHLWFQCTMQTKKKPWSHSSVIPGLMVTVKARIESPEAHRLYKLAWIPANNKEILCSQTRRKSNTWSLLSSAHMQPTYHIYKCTHVHYTCTQGERKGNFEHFKDERSRKNTSRCKHKQQILNFLTGQ